MEPTEGTGDITWENGHQLLPALNEDRWSMNELNKHADSKVLQPSFYQALQF